MDDAFENLAKRVNEDEYTLVVSAARLAKDVGGNLSETFELLADTLRRKIIMEGKIDALTSQGKLQGWVVGFLPIGMMLILMQMEPQAMYPLLHSVVGWGFLSVILIMELLGGLFIKKIVTIDI
jgi:tight adherence protein B